jgi:DNA-binding NarL/FixJ family response regulator
MRKTRQCFRVAIADDHALVRAGFRALIEAEPGLKVVGEAADGAEAIELARTAQPDVVLMDIRDQPDHQRGDG